MPITPPYASVDSSLVQELRATAVDSNKTAALHQGKNLRLSPLHCRIPDTSE